jgi:hypothetical protein
MVKSEAASIFSVSLVFCWILEWCDTGGKKANGKASPIVARATLRRD